MSPLPPLSPASPSGSPPSPVCPSVSPPSPSLTGPRPACARAATRPVSRRAARPVRLALCLAPLLLAACWAVANRPVLDEGVRRLVAADPWWLLAGAGFTCLTWVAASCARQGALPDPLPPGLLLASQFAAGAANHVAPGGLGAHAVTLRFLRGRGVPLERATASIGLYSLARSSAKTLVLLAFLAASPDWRRLRDLVPDGRLLLPLAAVAAGAVTVAGVLLTVVRPLRRPVAGLLRSALADARVVHRRPRRVLALWGGAVAMPLVQAGALACVGASLGLGLPWQQVVLAHLAAGTAVGAVPAPGGLAVDAALVWTLVAFGSSATAATATVIGYRVLLDWLPLVPGAVVLSALIRARVL
ncbi:lysylphosphatidylglycerol synthase transmembrane domain-containing protein [Streptomyces cinerochromogenes]|uniref:lysylphosphatidylglycerol synthase transmembrane domain-containing protein n=1 Tax=Streptomyces cinerochromogenes TaxID=66422 RepID=UPI001992FD0B|nr:lysylphosphatidylglycerol synthase domain-containing protein [Streptomyces cinerochromogenes]GGS75896.1 membrane protein [Streptomyces cinerochromogenes]